MVADTTTRRVIKSVLKINEDGDKIWQLMINIKGLTETLWQDTSGSM